MKAALLAIASLAVSAAAADTDAAAGAINQLGLDLHRLLAKPGENLCLSPYSIQSALAMTFSGADGATREEMEKVLHFPKDDGIHASFSALNRALGDVSAKTSQIATNAKKYGGPSEPLILTMANRLFGQTGYEFRPAFVQRLQGSYGAPMEMLNFRKAAEPARKHINDWVEEQTRKRIHDLLPMGMIKEDTRLVLVNAVYLKAPWSSEFNAQVTRPAPFHVNGGAAQPVPTMNQQARYGFAQHEGFRAVAVPYTGGEVQFLILVPDKVDGLADVEKGLTAATLAGLAKIKSTKVILHLPKFRIEGSTIELSDGLMALGMKTAFDKPKRSANFDRMAPRTPEEYLYISNVLHKTFLALDEKGTEAAAATAVVMMKFEGAAPEQTKPVEVKVDRPFLFAIQHVPSGACLFLGRVNDPAAK